VQQGQRLVVVSNRVPPASAVTPQDGNGSAPVGGLVSAIKPTMEKYGGLWLGWSGRSTQRRGGYEPTVSDLGPVQLATLDFAEEEASMYYIGYSNRTLWPLLHSFPGRVVIRHDTYRFYRRINRRFAEALFSVLKPGDQVWVHDFHLFHLGFELRQLGWTGSIGFFLHVPFPAADIFSILPWSKDTLEALLHYDLVGVHTDRYLRNLHDALDSELGGSVDSSGVYSYGALSSKLGVYSIGIDPSVFQEKTMLGSRSLTEELSLNLNPSHRLIIGVDRLDYTKGIPHRLRAFERMLEQHSNLRGKVIYVQISSPSRTRVPEYIQEKEQVERLVGQINGRFSEANWVPIRYLYRSYPQNVLARFYHDADVAMVTPLRDGMNLVAKEFVAAQGEENPGVLVLSQFSGAATSLVDAVIVNPYDVDGMAEATYRALRMPLAERLARSKSLMKDVFTDTAASWSESFLDDLKLNSRRAPVN